MLSGIIGKTSTGYETCYFRFAVSSGPVYLASGLSQYQFRREPSSFRLMSALALPTEDPSRIRMVSGKKSWELSRSSQTWTTSSGKIVGKDQMDAILHALRDINANGFGIGSEPAAALGLDAPATPFLVLTVDTGNSESALTVGNLTAKAVPQVPSVALWTRGQSSRAAHVPRKPVHHAARPLLETSEIRNFRPFATIRSPGFFDLASRPAVSEVERWS